VRTSQVLADTRKVDNVFDANLGEVSLITDTREQKQLGGIEDTSADDDLFLSCNYETSG
jgi:hypothetical protein